MNKYLTKYRESKNSRMFLKRSFSSMDEAVAFLTYACYDGKVMFEGRCVHSKPGV